MDPSTRPDIMALSFSIVTPVLNGMPALRGCVGSVRAQTCPDWEHLVQDGGSRDGTTDWLQTQSGLDWQSRPDAGMYDAINQGWQRSRGDILCWLNADEQYQPGTLARVAAAFARDPALDAVFGDYILVRPDGHPIAARREIPLRMWYAVNGPLYVLSCTLFVRRRVFERVGPFDTSFRIAGDKEWILRILKQGGRFKHLRQYLALFCMSGRNLSLSPAMQAESERIRDLYGAYPPGWRRRLPRAVRCIEKALAGCYGRRTVSYVYRTDADAPPTRVSGRVGSRLNWGYPREGQAR